MKNRVIFVDGAARVFSDAAESGKHSYDERIACAARVIPAKKIRLAGYLKFTFGPVCSGMTDEDWLIETETILTHILYEVNQ